MSEQGGSEFKTASARGSQGVDAETIAAKQRTGTVA
jgi:hypothetical protein